MDNKIKVEIATAAFNAAKDAVKDQIKNGQPNHGMPGERHTATVADVVTEILESYPMPEGYVDGETLWFRRAFRAALSGSMLNASALRQDLEGKQKGSEVVLMKSDKVETQYGV